MSPFLFSADLASTDLGRQARTSTTVADANEQHIAGLFAEFAAARANGRTDLMALIRDHAYAINPDLVDELDGFDYPAAA